MATESVDELENLIGKSLGWVKYDKSEDYEMSPFGGMWVESDGKSAHDISGLVVALQAYYTRECARKVLEELEALKLNTGWTADDYRAVLNERIAHFRAAMKEVGGGEKQ